MNDVNQSDNQQRKPNELDQQSKVSSDSSSRLPDKTRGKILEICDNPEIEDKRRVRHLEVMKMNTFNWRHGRFSKHYPTPQYLNSYFDYIDELDLTNPFEAREATVKLIRSNLKRIVLQEYFELVKGGNENSDLSKLIRDTIILLHNFQQVPLSNTATNTPFDMRDVQNLTNEDRNCALLVVRTALQKLREGKNRPSEALPS